MSLPISLFFASHGAGLWLDDQLTSRRIDDPAMPARIEIVSGSARLEIVVDGAAQSLRIGLVPDGFSAGFELTPLGIQLLTVECPERDVAVLGTYHDDDPMLLAVVEVAARRELDAARAAHLHLLLNDGRPSWL